MTTTSSIERNKTAVQRLINEVINAGRVDLCDRYLAADRIDAQDYGMPEGAANGHEGFRRVLGPFLEAFPDLQLTIQFIVADGKKLVVFLETTGTHLGALMGVPATGKRFRVHGVDIFEFNDAGLISHHTGVFNTFGMLSQLGLIPAPEMAVAA